MTTAQTQRSGARKGFTLVELMIVIVIIGILAATLLPNLIGGEGAKDAGRANQLRSMATDLESFRNKYGTYPSAGSHGMKYPVSGCAVSGYKSLVECLVSIGALEKDSDTYKKRRNDPDEGEKNDQGKVHQYLYCVNQNGNKYKLLSLAGKQDNDDYPGVDGKPAETGYRYIQVVSQNTKAEDLTSCNE